MTNGLILQPPSYALPAHPRARPSRHASSKPTNLSTLPEVTMPQLINGFNHTGAHSQNPLLIDLLSHPSGFRGPPSDDTASLASSLNSSGRHNSLKSEYSNSRSSFSTYSSRVSSPAGSSHSRDHSHPSPSNRTIQPPDHILRHQHQSVNSFLVSDLKQPTPYYRRQSDELSIRSSHSSRYSGSEFSDDFCPPLPVQPNAFSPHQPLPLPQSMRQDFLVTMATTSYYNQPSPLQVTSIHGSVEHSDDAGGSLPLHHYETDHALFMDAQKPPLPIPEAIFYDRASSPNMVIGAMSTFTEQLHQESMLLGGLLATSSTSS